MTRLGTKLPTHQKRSDLAVMPIPEPKLNYDVKFGSYSFIPVAFLLTAAIFSLLVKPAFSSAKEVERFTIHDTPRKVPELTFLLPDGSTHSLSEFHGKFVVLNIWATWCGPCRAEMPSLEKLAIKEPNIVVVTISQDRAGVIVVPKFFSQYNLKKIKPYIDSSGVIQRTLGITVMPTTVLINSDGLEVGRFIGGADWSSPEIVNLLKKLAGRH